MLHDVDQLNHTEILGRARAFEKLVLSGDVILGESAGRGINTPHGGTPLDHRPWPGSMFARFWPTLQCCRRVRSFRSSHTNSANFSTDVPETTLSADLPRS